MTCIILLSLINKFYTQISLWPNLALEYKNFKFCRFICAKSFVDFVGSEVYVAAQKYSIWAHQTSNLITKFYQNLEEMKFHWKQQSELKSFDLYNNKAKIMKFDSKFTTET